MQRLGVMIMSSIGLLSTLGYCQGSDKTGAHDHAKKQRLHPSAEVQRLLKAFAGDWSVSENFEVNESKRGGTRQGHATFTIGPGLSLVENYRSSGSAGDLRFLGILWWDPKLNAYPFFTCANNDGCEVRGTARWEGNNLVNTWEEEVDGKHVAFKDSFVDITPSSFTLVSEGVSGGNPIWRVVTKYVRAKTRTSNRQVQE
jgi:hypothetical protein